VVINAPIIYDAEAKPHPTVKAIKGFPVIKKVYFGFLYQEWGLEKGDVDVRRAERECISWTGKALKRLSLGIAGWPATGYSIKEWQWFSYTVGREFSTRVVLEKGLPGTWLFQVEGEDGSVVASQRGRL